MESERQPVRRRPRRRILPWVVIGAVAVALCVAFPPIRIVRLSVAAGPTTRPEASLDAALADAATKASDAHAVLAAIRRDPAEAKRKFGREVGIGGPYYLFIRGEGEVVKKESTAISIRLARCVHPDRNGG